MRNAHTTASIFAFVTCVLLAGCANTQPQDESSVANKPPKCKFDETYSCVERMGEPVRCFCADKDTLRELLEPTVQ